MRQKRVLTVQDISCFGKCSGTVALPVLSAAELEAVVLPTALLSTHTGGFEGYTFLDLTAEMERILSHWERIGLRFDMLYTGYFGSAEQLDTVRRYRSRLLCEGAISLIDPVLGDRGRLYSIYDGGYVDAMRAFCRGADLITPNVTEACLLSGVPYGGDRFEKAYMDAILTGLAKTGCRAAVITGVCFGEDQIGVVCRDFAAERPFTLATPRSDAPLHGSGDVFASALAGYLMNGFPLREALLHTLSFVSAAIRDTEKEAGRHWYGVKFEGSLGMISRDIQTKRLTDATEREDRA